MGMSAYIVNWKNAKLGGHSEFYDLIIKNFENEEGENYIETHSWIDFLEGNPDIAAKFADEVKEVGQDLEDNNGSVSYAFF